MPKNLKLNLNELKVQSFVTALTSEEKDRFKGGGSDGCDSPTTKVTHCSCNGSCGGSCSCGSDCLTCSPSWCSGIACC